MGVAATCAWAEGDVLAPPPPEEMAPPPPKTLPGGAPVQNANESTTPALSKMEVAGFFLQGSLAWHRLKIEDLDVIVTAGNRRLLPLLRLLKAFRIEKKEEADVLTFQPEGVPPRTLNLRTRQIRLNGHEDPVDLISAVSDVTGQRDVYLPAEVMAEIFGMTLEWNEAKYEFAARTSYRLKMWTLTMTSMKDVIAEDEEAKLPEAHPCARPRRDGLDFMELEGYGGLTALELRRSFDKAVIQGLRQTFWGGFQGGTYKVRLAQPSLLFEQGRLAQSQCSPMMVDWAEWTYRLPNTEVALGDSSFGVSDLVFPYVRLTGVRVNGLLGNTEKEAGPGGLSPGMRNYFVQPHDFEGYARAGSRVELMINDRVVDKREVVADSPTQPGMGAYRFEDIRLSPNIMNDVRIVITEPDGVQTQIRKNILPTMALLPAGRVAYIAATGTARDVARWQADGNLTTARVLYGVTDRLTVGGAMAVEERFFEAARATAFLGTFQRQFPLSSVHMGGSATWQPVEPLILTGSAAFSQLDGESGGSDDTALTLRADYYPVKNLNLGMQVFRYGPNFFNGQNLELYDRQGWALYNRWCPHPQWTVTGAVGRVADNLAGDLPKDHVVDFEHLDVTSTVVPRTSLTFAIDQTVPNWGAGPLTLLTAKGRSHLPWDITVVGEVSVGEGIIPPDRPEFFSGLGLPGLSLYGTPIVSEAVTKPVGLYQTVGQSYMQTTNRRRASVFHTYRSPGQTPVQVRTEVGMDLLVGQTSTGTGPWTPYFENRTEYLFDITGRSRLGVSTRLENKEWTALLFVSISNRYAFYEGQPMAISDPRILPDFGGIHGKVYVDYNANAVLDVGEPGIEKVKVVVNRTLIATTDSTGYFVLPSLRASSQVRVSLNLDTVPAIYRPTHGTQLALVLPRTLSVINLGVAPACSVGGQVLRTISTEEVKPVPGVRIFLTNKGKEAVVTDSITSGDGAYYLGDLLPGQYVIHVDGSTLPRNCGVDQTAMDVEIKSAREPQDLKVPAFLVTDTQPPGVQRK
jgi:hypothetical protein